MIQKLVIKNVALIENAEIEFCKGLNILSGETGAGKSVILDSVNFVLGAKADKSMIRYGEEACSVYAEFSIEGNEQARSALQEADIEAEDDCLIVSRKFTLDGKSTVRINGIPANTTMLRKITSCLIDVHGQSEHFFLLKESNQLKVLDNVTGNALVPFKEALRKSIKDWKNDCSALEELGVEGDRNRKMDILSFQINEISSANIKEGEEEELIARRNKLNATEKIIQALRNAESALQADGSGIDALRSANRSLSSISNIDREYADLTERLENLKSEAEDVADCISSLFDDVYFDEGEADEIERRLEEYKKLRRKYGATVADILEFYHTASEEFDRLNNSGEETERLKKRISEHKKTIYSLCRKITELRKGAAYSFCGRVIEQLTTLNIPSAQFSVRFNEYTEADVERVTNEGLDDISFEFSANAGEPMKPLSKIISGGEMSRFMLSVKTQLSGINGITCYIFDEIDAGISGQTAKVVAEKFADISRNTQIIAVSHLAQIACMADREFLIQKKEEEGKTKTSVIELDESGKIFELIRLLGGEENSKVVAEHAKEMLTSAERYKKSLA